MLENLPIYAFVLAFFIVFVLFIWGGISLLRYLGDPRIIEKSRRRILISLYSLLALLLIAFVFFLVSYLLQRGEVLRPPEAPGEFPLSPAYGFPPGPQFIEIDGHYFEGPWQLRKNNIIEEPAVYAILCKIAEEYDIIYIGQTGKAERLPEHKEYGCWIEGCDFEDENLYLAIFRTPPDKYGSTQRRELKEELENQIIPFCPLIEAYE